MPIPHAFEILGRMSPIVDWYLRNGKRVKTSGFAGQVKLVFGGALSTIVGALVLILFTPAPIPANSSHQENEEKLSSSEEREVREFARQIAASIKKTRDLSPYLNKQPARKVFDKVITEPNASTALIDNDVVSTVGNNELRRFNLAMLNIGYMGEAYIHGRFLLQKTAVRDLPPQQQFPPHVARLMNRNPTIKGWWKNDDSSASEQRITSVAQFYSVLNTFNKATTAMRTFFTRYPPERTATYRQNLKYLVPFLKEITVDTCKSEQDCAGLPLQTQIITVNLPVLHLLLVRLDGRLQVWFIGILRD